ncbi:Seed imbibition 2 [Dorcoceras hygrometricum]|uniref:Seed imbibition 2 n=1 Tax=Dorcoceras hygrometricum TaxID=472368 RepID=A0A2Z7D3H9_9LAMI|nr:Seed imbibition 2 [Dorcoceras hygrometricum]
MAATLINNTIQIYFESVYGMADEGMVQMFKALESSGLRGFLGCFFAIYEVALVEFFQNYSVRDNKVVSAVQGKAVEISEECISMGAEHLKTSCKKREMKFEFRLLNDILVNWGRLLFNIFKDMVTPASKQARGFAVQICILLLKGEPDLDLGESKEFPPHKILTAKTVGTYVAKNKNITVEEVVDKPVVKKTAPKRIPAPAIGDLAAKNKRTTVLGIWIRPPTRQRKNKNIEPGGDQYEKQIYIIRHS